MALSHPTCCVAEMAPVPALTTVAAGAFEAALVWSLYTSGKLSSINGCCPRGSSDPVVGAPFPESLPNGIHYLFKQSGGL